MTQTFTIKRHDRAPSVSFVVTDVEGFPLDLTAFTTVKFLMRKRGATLLTVERAATFDDKPGGIVRYDWQPGDTAEAGTYFAEFELQDADGRKQTAPARGLIRIDIAGDLDNA